ncbi:MAG TPA: BamA/TamA family outer membrane protein, partial [Polyangia bacterium]|nr:BamA/TamA family outer membrane protein [Polyangia bacterium]
ELDTLETVRERLNSSGLFADTNVWWEQSGAGVRINIAVKDKFPWAPVPTASWSANNRAFGLLFVHGNLFGRGKQMLIGGRIADVDSGAVLAYRDPALFGSWVFWQLSGSYKREVIPEYDPNDLAPDTPIRETVLSTFAFEPTVGIAWFRRVRTQVGWRLAKVEVNNDASTDPMNGNMVTQLATKGGTVGMGRASVTFDFRAREFAVMTGSALGGSLDISSPAFKSDFTYWRAGVGFEQGIKFFRTHNLVYNVSATVGHNLPLWFENTAGGMDLRGYLYQQFRGDTQLAGKVEYHFPLFSVGSLDFRALGFYDASALWYRELPTEQPGSDMPFVYRDTPDQRTFSSKILGGFDASRDIHTSVGAGLRFFLRSVAVPLVGFDAGYGIEAHTWRFTLIVGA